MTRAARTRVATPTPTPTPETSPLASSSPNVPPKRLRHVTALAGTSRTNGPTVATARLFFLILWGNRNQTGVAELALPAMKAQAALTDRTVYRTLGALERLGAITIVRRPRPSKTHREYVFAFPADAFARVGLPPQFAVTLGPLGGTP